MQEYRENELIGKDKSIERNEEQKNIKSYIEVAIIATSIFLKNF